MVEAVFVLGMLVILGCWLKVLLELYGLKPPHREADRHIDNGGMQDER